MIHYQTKLFLSHEASPYYVKHGMGIFSFTPLGLLYLEVISKDLEARMYKISSIKKVSKWDFPCMFNLRALDKTRRRFTYGPELFITEGYYLTPTSEEIALPILQMYTLYAHFAPALVYQIGKKYRNELRPESLKRTKEFLMFDAYSVHSSFRSAISTYVEMKTLFKDLFRFWGLEVKIIRKPSEKIGGPCSHEFLLLNDTSIELAHTFILGTYYSSLLDIKFRDTLEYAIHCCYGIGIGRLLDVILRFTPYSFFDIAVLGNLDIQSSKYSNKTILMLDNTTNIKHATILLKSINCRYLVIYKHFLYHLVDLADSHNNVYTAASIDSILNYFFSVHTFKN